MISISIRVEDRKSKNPVVKYKHYIDVKIFTKHFHVVIRSPSIGYYDINGVSVMDNEEMKKHW